jgi:hypothetical protein
LFIKLGYFHLLNCVCLCCWSAKKTDVLKDKDIIAKINQ